MLHLLALNRRNASQFQALDRIAATESGGDKEQSAAQKLSDQGINLSRHDAEDDHVDQMIKLEVIPRPIQFIPMLLAKTNTGWLSWMSLQMPRRLAHSTGTTGVPPRLIGMFLIPLSAVVTIVTHSNPPSTVKKLNRPNPGHALRTWRKQSLINAL